MLTSQQTRLVRDSWQLLAPIAREAASLFYNRLFETTPSLRPMFAHADMDAQGQKLMQMVGVVVAKLDQLDDLMPSVAALGARHRDYGVQPEHYTLVANALLWTIEHGLGSEFTPDVRVAWTTALTAVADAMQHGDLAVAS